MPEVIQYAVRFHGGPEGSGNGIRAQVHLFGQGNKMVGYIDFYESSDNLPKDQHEPHIVMSMPLSTLHSVVDILRNEGPIYLYWQERLKNAYLGTGQEPVGEGELPFK